jgi:tetratricopeptide (TPR) repeat protein
VAPENLRRSLGELRRAIARDSSYAPAWALYADALAVAPAFGDTMRAPADVRREAEAAARRAIALAPGDPRGWSALGMVLQFDYAFRDALAANDRALAIDASDATTLERRAEILLCLGRLADAEAAARRAVALDPLAAINNHALALVLIGQRRMDEAIRFSTRAVELEPQVPLFRLLQGIAFLGAGRLAESNGALQAVGMLNDATRAINRGIVDPAHRAAGLAGIAAWRRAVPDRVSLHVGLAFWYSALGQTDSAFAMLERGVAARDSGVPLMLTYYGFDPLRRDPRWPEFVLRMRGG